MFSACKNRITPHISQSAGFQTTLGCCGTCFVFKVLSIWHLVGVIPVFCSRHFPFHIGLLWYPCCVPGTFHVTMNWCGVYSVFQALSMSHWDAVIPVLCSRHFPCNSGLLWYLFLCYRPCPFDIGSLWWLFCVPGTFHLTLSYCDVYFVFQALSCHIGLLWYLFMLLGLSLWHWVWYLFCVPDTFHIMLVWCEIFLCSRCCPCDIGLLWYLFRVPDAVHVILGCYNICFPWHIHCDHDHWDCHRCVSCHNSVCYTD